MKVSDIVQQTGLLKGLGRQVDQIAIGMSRLKNAALSTHLGGLVVLATGFHKTTKASQGLYKEGVDQLKAFESMTIAGKLLHKGLLKHTRSNRIATGVYRMLNTEKMANFKTTQRLLMGFTSLIGSIMTIFSVAMTLILALALLSIAFQGANTPLLNMTENMGALHDVVEGLVLSLTGEGGGSLLDGFLAALVVGTVVAVVFSATIGILVAGLIAAGAVYHKLKDTIVGVTGALIYAGAIFGIFVAWVVSGISVVSALGLSFYSVLLPGFMAIMGGIALLVSVASGAGSDLWAVIRTLIAVILIAVGIVILTVGGIGIVAALAIAAVLGVIALIIRKRDVVWDALVGLKNGIAAILSGILGLFLDFVTVVGKILAYLIMSPLVGMSKLYQGLEKKLGEMKALVLGFAQEIADEVASIPIIGGVVSGIGGLLGRAEGGPVTGGQPYIVGERGPELFTPGSSGNITPNHEMGGQVITMNINVSGVTDRSDKRALAREIGDMLTQELRRQGGSPTRGRF